MAGPGIKGGVALTAVSAEAASQRRIPVAENVHFLRQNRHGPVARHLEFERRAWGMALGNGEGNGNLLLRVDPAHLLQCVAEVRYVPVCCNVLQCYHS